MRKHAAKTGAKIPAGGAASAILRERQGILTDKSDFFIREAYKTLRTNLYFATADVEGCRVIMVTSAIQSEGKSITALNLAISLSDAGNRVLLIDCDLRRPKLARLVNIADKNGLSDLLVHPQMQETVIHTYRHTLDVLLAGHMPPNPSELLGSARMANLLKVLKERYDYILLDTSPVNVVTDACVLTPQVSGTVFVVRAGQSERGAVRYALNQLNYVHAKVYGFVLNGTSAEKAPYGKKYYGRYGLRYGFRYGFRYGYGYGSRYSNQYDYGYGAVDKKASSIDREAYRAVVRPDEEAWQEETDRKP